MSQETRSSKDQDFDLVREAWASARRDIRDALRFYCEDIEIKPFGATLEGGVYRGHQQVVDWWDNEIVPSWEAFEVTRRGLSASREPPVGLRSLAGVRTYQRHEAGNAGTWVVEVREGKIASWQTFTDRTEAFEAVGLSEQDAHAHP